MRVPFPPSPLTVFSVEDTTAQICWGSLPAGPVEAVAADSVTTVAHRGGPGSIVLTDLPPASSLVIRITWVDGSASLRAKTLDSPPGELLGRLATVSDLHLGATRWGFSKLMRETTPHHSGEAAPFRCARAAITEARSWGAEHLVVKGDAAHHRHPHHYAEVGRLLDQFPDLPVHLLPGNHDVDRHSDAALPNAVGEREVPYVRTADHVDLPGLRLVVGDTTIEGRGPGTVARVGDDLLDRAADSSNPVLVAIHQQLQPYPVITHWPPGIRAPESTRFLDRLAAVRPQALVTTGHSHRNRVRHHGPIVHTEVASTRDWPGVWAGYAIHEGGVRQVVRRIAAPEAMEWTEYSKNAVLTMWQRWSPGRLEDRCLVRRWD